VAAPASEPNEPAVIDSHSTRLRATQRSGPTRPAGRGTVAAAAALWRNRWAAATSTTKARRNRAHTSHAAAVNRPATTRSEVGSANASRSESPLRRPRTGDVPNTANAAGRPTTSPAKTASAISARTALPTNLTRQLL
jgi:hypothetical protein